MNSRSLALVALGVTFMIAETADARPWRVNDLPSGSVNSCLNCHISSSGGDARNVFGAVVEASYLAELPGRPGPTVDWGRPLARLDSDGDGYSNGEELGDPDGTGRPTPGFDPSLPGDATSNLCGDREINGPEECDGPIRGGATTCVSLGHGAGTLRCWDDCVYNFSGCSDEAVCGDDALQAGEPCDGIRFVRERTCEEFGFGPGEVLCSDCDFDFSECGAAICGDDRTSGDEECDGDEPVTCESLGLGDGTAPCTDACVFDVSACEVAGPVCGDGVVEDGEECEGEDLGEVTCGDLGFDLGSVGCTDECLLDDTECRDIACGDGIIDEGEACEGDDFAGLDCTDFDLQNGELTCSDTCEVDTTSCAEESDEGQPDTPPDVSPDVGPDAAPDTAPDGGEPDVNEGSGSDSGDSSGGSGSGGGCSTSPATSGWGLAGLLALIGLRRRRRTE